MQLPVRIPCEKTSRRHSPKKKLLREDERERLDSGHAQNSSRQLPSKRPRDHLTKDSLSSRAQEQYRSQMRVLPGASMAVADVAECDNSLQDRASMLFMPVQALLHLECW